MMNTQRVSSLFSSFTRFFSEDTPQSTRRRSQAGLLVAIVLLPSLLAVLACMPVPVGDPEKSRIDPEISGFWLTDLDAPQMMFDPYDKRTWLVAWFNVEEKNPVEHEKKEGEEIDEEKQSVPTITLLRKGQYEIGEIVLFKGWLTVIEGERFLTLERKLMEPGATPEYWYVFRVKAVNGNSLQLQLVNSDFDGFDNTETAEEAEKVIRQNLENADLYDDNLEYQKISPDDLDLVEQLLEDFGLDTGP